MKDSDEIARIRAAEIALLYVADKIRDEANLEIRAAIREAIESEREACALIADSYADIGIRQPAAIAAAIRKRGTV